MEKVILWFRQDLRLDDNPAWVRALESGKAVIPVYIHAPQEAGRWRAGGASRWWLHHALMDLGAQLAAKGLKLILRRGESEDEIAALLAETGANSVYWNRSYEPYRMRIDGRIKSRLKDQGIDVWSGNASLLREPWEVSTQTGNAYKVFTPYSRACAKISEREPVNSAAQPIVPGDWPDSLELDSLSLLPEIPWDKGFPRFWNPTREGGMKRLAAFLKASVGGYDAARDIPSEDGTSRLSPYLHFGQIGPREVAGLIRGEKDSPGLKSFHRELIWREFAYHVLYHFPDTPEQPLQPKYARFPWEKSEDQLKAWQEGRTGYPIVDAGMRQLWQTGWMHNRVRMIVASLLVKHLLHSWEHGSAWFWNTLVDADLASNTLGWQWAGGCGADAAPYFRIFNPITQGVKFDPEGEYIREYVPELATVQTKFIHIPWEMPDAEQARVGCRIGMDYPAPIIEHKAGRERALQALARLKEMDA